MLSKQNAAKMDNKDAVALMLSRINNVSCQKEFLVTLCTKMIDKDIPEELKKTIVNDCKYIFL